MRDESFFIEDIISSIDLLVSYAEDVNPQTLETDIQLRDSIMMRFIIMGEAVSWISDEIKEANPQIEWQQIKRFRNRLAHGYFDIAYEIIIDTISELLPIKEKLVELQNRLHPQ